MPGSDTYHVAARLLHWAMAVGFAFVWGCGYAMPRLVVEDGPWEDALKSLHISVGVTLLVLLVARVVVRILYPPPPLPPGPGISVYERTAAHVGHFALLALPAVVIYLGWMKENIDRGVFRWFGVAMPAQFPCGGRGARRGNGALGGTHAQVDSVRHARAGGRPRGGNLQASVA